MAVAYVPAGRIPANDQNRRINDASLYWKRLQQLAVFQEPGPVTSLDFSSRQPYMVASTSSVRMTLYDSVICEPTNLSGRFKDSVYGVRFRKDGQLVAIGGAEGKLRVFDVDRNSGNGKTPLRSVRASSSNLRVVDFSASGHNLFSMGDDGYLKLWDLSNAMSKPTSEILVHTDSIRSGAASSRSEHLVMTSGYDHKVKLWDMRISSRESGPVVNMDVGAPVEKVIFLPSENLLASASGPIVKIWDLTAGGRQLISIQQHHRTVTSLCLGGDGASLLTGAIDRRINIFNIKDFSMVHSMSMAAPVMALTMSPDDDTLAIGMGNLLALHRRAALSNVLTAGAGQEGRKEATIRKTATKVFVQTKQERVKKELEAPSVGYHKLDRVDSLMMGYKHGAAVEMMFGKAHYYRTRQEQVVGWLRLLVHRRVIRRALSGQESNIQMHLLKFLYEYMFKNNYFDILRHVAEAFFDVYANEALEFNVSCMAVKLKDSIGRELAVQKQLCQAIGSLEMILNTGRYSNNDASSRDKDIFGEPRFSSVPLPGSSIARNGLEGEELDYGSDAAIDSETDELPQHNVTWADNKKDKDAMDSTA